jgi:HK97 gp10 family phage protein
MASSSTFRVTQPEARRLVVERNIHEIAEQLAADAEANTPHETGRLAASYRVEPGREPGTSLVVNDAPYARFVEYGTRYMPAQAPLGRALAEARARSAAR